VYVFIILGCLGGLTLSFQGCSNSGFRPSTNPSSSSADSLTEPLSVPIISLANPVPSLMASRTVSIPFQVSTPTDAVLAYASCTLDTNPLQDCTSLSANLTALTDGDHSVRINAQDSLGQRAAEFVILFRVDATIPQVGVSQSPAAVTGATSATFAFNATDSLSGVLKIECALDSAPLQACTSPVTLSALQNGSHTFNIVATDFAGNVSTMVSKTWTIQVNAPVLTITQQPLPFSKVNSASFAFTGTVNGVAITNFECKLDSAAYLACISAKAYSNLPDGVHAFNLRGQDLTGAMSAPISVNWVVDTIAPTLPMITSNVSAQTTQVNVTFQFSATDATSNVASFSCSLDGLAFSTCTSPFTTSTVSLGNHTFQVRATDMAGNQSAASQFSWTLNAGSPVGNGTGPSALVYTPGDSSVALSWNWVTGTTGFNVKRASQSKGPYVVIHTCNAPTYNACASNIGVRGAFTDTAVAPAQDYYYVVTGIVNGTETNPSAEVHVRPGVPSGLVVTASDRQAILTWNNYLSAQAYDVEYATQVSGPFAALTVCSGTSQKLAVCLHDKLSNGVQYFYRVRATGLPTASGRSGYSDIVSGTPTASVDSKSPMTVPIQPLTIVPPGIPDPNTLTDTSYGPANDSHVHQAAVMVQSLFKAGKTSTQRVPVGTTMVPYLNRNYNSKIFPFLNLNMPEFPIGSAQSLRNLDVGGNIHYVAVPFVIAGDGTQLHGIASPFAYISPIAHLSPLPDGSAANDLFSLASLTHFARAGVKVVMADCNFNDDPAFHLEIERFADSGGITVCAAGNNATRLNFRASRQIVVGGGINSGGIQRWSLANWGAHLKIVVNVTGGYTFQYDDDKLGFFSATSYAIEQVASHLAILQFAFPTMNRHDLLQALYDSAIKMDQNGPTNGNPDRNNYVGFGFAMLDGAVQLLSSLPSGQHMVSRDRNPPNIELLWPAADGSTIAQRAITKTKVDILDNSDLEVTAKHFLDGTQICSTLNFSNHDCSLDLSRLPSGTTHVYRVQAVDTAGNPSTVTVNFQMQ
ncbi:MAG: hypothetical protein K2X47_17050, partial [Bdellovibrionales bacterium]|nr:hypothetical protein [Bdellovibrionales bacterium]